VNWDVENKLHSCGCELLIMPDVRHLDTVDTPVTDMLPLH